MQIARQDRAAISPRFLQFAICILQFSMSILAQAHPMLAFSCKPNKAERLMKLRTPNLNRSALALLLALALMCATLFGWPQDIAGGASALLGQDIIGGANV